MTPRTPPPRRGHRARGRPPVSAAPAAPASAAPPAGEPGPLDRWWWLVGMMAIGLAAVLTTYSGYGSNWDEAVQARYGELAVDYFRSGLTDRRVNEFRDLRFYGPLVEMIPAILTRVVTTGIYELRHLVIPLFGLAAVAAIFGYASLARQPGLPLLAAVSLATMPRFYGDWFNNSKDVPFACLFALSMYALARLASSRPGAGPVVACGLAFGLALDVRPGGFPLLLLFLAVALALSWALARAEARPSAATLAGQALGVLAIAWVVMVLPWPWAHESPLAHPLAAMREAAAFTSAYPVLFGGAMVNSDALPRDYLIRYLLITTPPLLLVLGLVGVVTGLARVRRAADSPLFLLSLAWLVLPPLLFLVLRPNVYDGIRHFLFVLPALAVLAAYGAGWLAGLAGPRGRSWATAACLVALLLPIKDLVALHPYQTTYFNALVGGVAGADGNYDTEYWLTSYREAIAWVNAQAARRPEAVTTVAVAGDDYIVPWVDHYVRANVRAVVLSAPPSRRSLPEGVDYYIATRRFGFDRAFPGAPVVHTIGRGGAVFTVIKARAPGS